MMGAEQPPSYGSILDGRRSECGVVRAWIGLCRSVYGTATRAALTGARMLEAVPWLRPPPR